MKTLLKMVGSYGAGPRSDRSSVGDSFLEAWGNYEAAQCGSSEKHREILTGHSAGNVHEDDIHKELISLKTLQDRLERLQYPEILQVLTIKGESDKAA